MADIAETLGAETNPPKAPVDNANKELMDKKFDDLSAKEIQTLGSSVIGTVELLKKLAARTGDAGKIETSDVKTSIVSSLPGGLNGKLEAMRVAVKNNEALLDGVKDSQVQALLEDHRNLFNRTEAQSNVITTQASTDMFQVAYDDLQSRYSHELDFGKSMSEIVMVVKSGKSAEEFLPTLSGKQKDLAKDVYALLGDKNSDNVFRAELLKAGRTFQGNVDASNDKLKGNYNFDSFLKDFADMDDDGTVENVNSEKKQWKKLDAITLGLSYFMRDKTAVQGQVQSELGLYEQIRKLDINGFNAKLAEMGIGSIVLTQDAISTPEASKATITQIRNAINMRADLLGSRKLGGDAVDGLVESSEMHNAKLMQKEVKAALEKISLGEIKPEQKDQIIAELTKKGLEFQTSILGAKDIQPAAIAQKFGQAITQGSADHLSFVALDLRVLKSFYESSNINLKGSAGLTLAASKDGILPIASIGGEAGFTLMDGSKAGKEAFDHIKRNTTINIGAGVGATLMGVNVVAPYISTDLLWSDKIGTVEKLGFAMRQLTKEATQIDKNGVISVNIDVLKNKLDSSVVDAFSIMSKAINDGQAKLSTTQEKNAFALTLISRFEKVMQASAIQQNKDLRGIGIAGIKVAFAAGLLFAGPVIQYQDVSIKESQVTTEKTTTLEKRETSPEIKALGLTLTEDAITVDQGNTILVVDSQGNQIEAGKSLPIKGKAVDIRSESSTDNSTAFRKITITLTELPAGQVSAPAPVVEEVKYQVPEFIDKHSSQLATFLHLTRTGWFDGTNKRISEATIALQHAVTNGDANLNQTFNTFVNTLLSHKAISGSKDRKALVDGLKTAFTEGTTSDANRFFLEALNMKTQGSKESRDIAKKLNAGNDVKGDVLKYLTQTRKTGGILGDAFAGHLGVDKAGFKTLLSNYVNSGLTKGTLEQAGNAVYSQVGRNQEKGMQGLVPVQKGVDTIGKPQEITGDMRTQILAKLYPNETDRAKHVDDKIFMTLAFEKDAECFNPIIYSVPPAPANPPTVPSIPGSLEGSQVTITTKNGEIIARTEIKQTVVTPLVKVANFNPPPPETPPPPPAKKEEVKPETKPKEEGGAIKDGGSTPVVVNEKPITNSQPDAQPQPADPGNNGGGDIVRSHSQPDAQPQPADPGNNGGGDIVGSQAVAIDTPIAHIPDAPPQTATPLDTAPVLGQEIVGAPLTSPTVSVSETSALPVAESAPPPESNPNSQPIPQEM